jgi:Na+/melibiose symporter-like transporter
MIVVFVGFLIAISLLVSWGIGSLAYRFNGVTGSRSKRVLVGFVSILIGGLILSFIEGFFESKVYYQYSSLAAVLIPLVVAYVAVNIFELQDDNQKENNENNFEEKKGYKMSNINLKKLIRIPVWALYSLIVATVVMSFVMLVKIWFPETIDQELVWRIVLSYGVFLISALVISNLTDKIKLMRLFQDEEK